MSFDLDLYCMCCSSLWPNSEKLVIISNTHRGDFIGNEPHPWQRRLFAHAACVVLALECSLHAANTHLAGSEYWGCGEAADYCDLTFFTTNIIASPLRSKYTTLFQLFYSVQNQSGEYPVHSCNPIVLSFKLIYTKRLENLLILIYL